MPETAFVYRTYIRTTPERLWRALTEPACARRYWRLDLESDWRVGSTVTWHDGDVTIADPDQRVVEAEPHRRLAYTWHTFTPEWAAAHGFDDEQRTRWASERRTKVTFDIEPLGDIVKLTVVHDDFDPDSAILPMVSEGWPRILADIKTLLETGEILPTGP